MSQIRIPVGQRPRLDALCRQHGHASAQAFAGHLVSRALGFQATPDPAALQAALTARTEQDGYSGVEELVEHLLERGLAAYETAESDPEKLQERLRGLGYID